jgi:hypothetical protein
MISAIERPPLNRADFSLSSLTHLYQGYKGSVPRIRRLKLSFNKGSCPLGLTPSTMYLAPRFMLLHIGTGSRVSNRGKFGHKIEKVLKENENAKKSRERKLGRIAGS